MKIISRKEALELGLKTYFTGKPCKWGHIAERRTDSKNCVICLTKRSKRWRKKHPDRKRKSNKIWEKNNHEKFKECQRLGQRRYRETNSGQLRNLCDHTSARLKSGKISKRKFELLEYTPEEFCTHLLKGTNFKSVKEAWEAGYAVDHIVPIKYISDNIKDKALAFKVAMDLINLRLICKKENGRKKDFTDSQMVQGVIKVLWAKYHINEKGDEIAA